MNRPAKILPLNEARSHRASAVAQAILAGFDRHYRLFRDASRQAKRNFESGDWAAARVLARELGFANVAWYRGGTTAWQAANLPTKMTSRKSW